MLITEQYRLCIADAASVSAILVSLSLWWILAMASRERARWSSSSQVPGALDRPGISLKLGSQQHVTPAAAVVVVVVVMLLLLSLMRSLLLIHESTLSAAVFVVSMLEVVLGAVELFQPHSCWCPLPSWLARSAPDVSSIEVNYQVINGVLDCYKKTDNV